MSWPPVLSPWSNAGAIVRRVSIPGIGDASVGGPSPLTPEQAATQRALSRTSIDCAREFLVFQGKLRSVSMGADADPYASLRRFAAISPECAQWVSDQILSTTARLSRLPGDPGSTEVLDTLDYTGSDVDCQRKWSAFAGIASGLAQVPAWWHEASTRPSDANVARFKSLHPECATWIDGQLARMPRPPQTYTLTPSPSSGGGGLMMVVGLLALALAASGGGKMRL